MNDKNRLKSLIRFFFVALSLLLLVISVQTGSRKLETGAQSPLRPIFSEGVAPGLAGFPSGTSDLHSNVYLTMKNPSAVYCRDLGYDFRVIDNLDGSQDSICTLPDKTICPSWDFLNGKCGQAYSVCARNGLKTVTLAEGNNPFSKEYAVCADANGKLLESVAEMTNLVEKAGGQARNEGVDPLATPGGSLPVYESPVGNLPASFDWRNYNGSNWTTPVKNQGICGSCWAFSAVGVAEVAINIASNNPILDLNLSEQYLVTDCASAGNCNGGNSALALQFIRDNGIPDEACLPYLDGGTNGCTYNSSGCDASMCTYASAGECSDYRCTNRCSDWASRVVKIQSVTYLGSFPDIAVMKQALIDHGPLSVAMNMGGSFNTSNVYTCPDNSNVNHAVIIVGYNDPGGYWVVKNSWGTSWGTNGYFHVMYDNCAIQSYPYYAVGKSYGNPIPSIASLSPSSADAGSTAFTLTVNGSKFVSVSVVRWNGSDRATTFVSSTKLTASISAADIASAGTTPVTVFSPTPSGGSSSAVNFTIKPTNPVPSINNLNPSSTIAGSSAFTLTVNGSNFVSASMVRGNGSNRLTTFVTSTKLTTPISEADIASAGTISVTVFSPAPGGGTSAAAKFTIHPRVIQDEFNHAITISSLPFVDNLVILGATTAADDPTFPKSCIAGSGQGYHTIWYRFVPPKSGELILATSGSDYDTVLGVWTGSRASLVSQACNNNFSGMGLQSKINLQVTAGVEYYVEVASYSPLSTGGSLQFNAYMANKTYLPLISDR